METETMSGAGCTCCDIYTNLYTFLWDPCTGQCTIRSPRKIHSFVAGGGAASQILWYFLRNNEEADAIQPFFACAK